MRLKIKSLQLHALLSTSPGKEKIKHQ